MTKSFARIEAASPVNNDTELFALFSVDLGQLIAGTNGQSISGRKVVGEPVEHIDPTPHKGHDVFEVTVPRVRPMTAKELESKRREERKARTELLATAAEGIDWESEDGPPLASLIEAPRYQGARNYS